MVMTELPDHNNIIRQIEVLAADQERIIVAVAGPPGCGKSTLAKELCRQISLPCCVVPMDGFHFGNDTLSELGLLQKKGAPETFDLEGFLKLIKGLRYGNLDQFPTFDRDADCVIPAGGKIPVGTRILIVEGNYLLFNEPDWAELARFWDASIWVDVPQSILEERLIRRWTDQGMSTESALVRAHDNDMVNMRRVLDRALSATWVIRS